MNTNEFKQTAFHISTNEEFTWENSRIFNYELIKWQNEYDNETLIKKLTEIKNIRMSAIKLKKHIIQSEIDYSIVKFSNGNEVNIKPEWMDTWVNKSKNLKYKNRLLNLSTQEEFDKELDYSHRELNYVSKIPARIIVEEFLKVESEPKIIDLSNDNQEKVTEYQEDEMTPEKLHKLTNKYVGANPILVKIICKGINEKKHNIEEYLENECRKR